jgi:hypothetical protein
LLNLLGEAASREVAFNAKRAGDYESVFRSGLVMPAKIPERLRPVLREGAVVKADVVGLNGFDGHGSIIGKTEALCKRKQPDSAQLQGIGNHSFAPTGRVPHLERFPRISSAPPRRTSAADYILGYSHRLPPGAISAID